MSRRCELTGKQVQSGNRVSHSNRKTRRRFKPNIQSVSFISDALGATVTLKVSVNALRSIDHNGGLDAYLLSTANDKLPEEAAKLKKQVKKALQAKQAAA